MTGLLATERIPSKEVLINATNVSSPYICAGLVLRRVDGFALCVRAEISIALEAV
jgi:hypothetical protein